MRNLLILAVGTSGPMMANHLRSKLKKDQWNISIVGQYKTNIQNQVFVPSFWFEAKGFCFLKSASTINKSS